MLGTITAARHDRVARAEGATEHPPRPLADWESAAAAAYPHEDLIVTRTGAERVVAQPAERAGHPPLLNPTEAAEAARMSRSTLRRRLAADTSPGAQRDVTGARLVPVTDLIAAGLTPTVPRPPSPPIWVRSTRVVLPSWEAALAVAEAQQTAAERLATDRLDRTYDLRMALRHPSGAGMSRSPDRCHLVRQPAPVVAWSLTDRRARPSTAPGA